MRLILWRSVNGIRSRPKVELVRLLSFNLFSETEAGGPRQNNGMLM